MCIRHPEKIKITAPNTYCVTYSTICIEFYHLAENNGQAIGKNQFCNMLRFFYTKSGILFLKT